MEKIAMYGELDFFIYYKMEIKYHCIGDKFPSAASVLESNSETAICQSGELFKHNSRALTA